MQAQGNNISNYASISLYASLWIIVFYCYLAASYLLFSVLKPREAKEFVAGFPRVISRVFYIFANSCALYIA